MVNILSVVVMMGLYDSGTDRVIKFANVSRDIKILFIQFPLVQMLNILLVVIGYGV